MILGADEPAVVRKFDNFDEVCGGVFAYAFHTGLLEAGAEVVVELEAVAVAFADAGLAVGLGGAGAGKEVAVVGAEAHGASHGGDRLLFLHEVDDVVGGVGLHLRRVGFGEAEDVAGELDDHTLHSEADAEGGDVVLAAPFQGRVLSLDAALAETGGYDDAVEVAELGVDVFGCDALGVDILQVKDVVGICGGLEERFVDGLVGVLKLDIFSDKSDAYLLVGGAHFGQELFPGVHVGLAFGFESHLAHDDLVEVLLVHQDGDVVDAAGVDALDYGVGGHVAEQRYLPAHCRGDVVFGAEHEYVRLDTELLELLDGVLCGLGLQLFGRADVGDVGEVEAEAVVFEFPAELTDGLKEGERLDVAHDAADFGDDEVEIAGLAEGHDVALDLVGDVGDDLYGLAEIVAAALFLDDALVDASGGHIVGACGLDVGEPFVVSEVEVGLMAVDGDVALAVFVGVEGTGVDVDVGVELLDSNPEPACFEKAGER